MTNISGGPLNSSEESGARFTVPPGNISFGSSNSCQRGVIDAAASRVGAFLYTNIGIGYSCFEQFNVVIAPDATAGLFTPNAEYEGPYSAALSWGTIRILPSSAPTLTLNAAPNPSTVGEAVTFTARLTGAVNPTAPIVFSEGGAELASVAIVGDTATFTTDALGVGDHTIRADFAGDADNEPADPVFILQQVNPPLAPTLTLNATPNPSTVGEAVTFTARIIGAVNPTAPIVFSEGGAELASVAIVGDTATFTTDALGVGDHTIRADFAGDADNEPADPVFILQQVNGFPAISILPETLPAGRMGEAYSQQLTSVGGDGGPYAYALVAGQLPDGMSLTAAGLLSGPPQAAGGFAITVQSSDQSGSLGTRSYTLAVAERALIEIQPDSLPVAQVGAPYAAQLSASGGDGGPYRFSLTGGNLPVGLQLNAGGSISGTPVAAGSSTFTVQADDQAGSDPGSRTYTVVVEATETTTTLVSSNNPADVGENVTFTATISGAPGTSIQPTGDVVFTLDGAAQATVPLVAGQASFSTSTLSAGSHIVIARYGGDAGHVQSASQPLEQVVRASGSIIVRVETGGSDGAFAFSSPTPALNFAVVTVAGGGEGPSIDLQQGEYVVTLADARAQGFRILAVACSDEDSAGDTTSGRATIRLAAGEVVICTFTMIDTGRETAAMIGQFMERRGTLLLSEQHDIQRRIDRLDGHVSGGGNPLATAMAYLPGIVDSGSLSTSISLAQIRRLSGEVKPARFDLWADVSYTRFQSEGPGGVSESDGGFARAAFGADWLVNRNLLIGGFFQVDHLSQDIANASGNVSGTGWLAGPYLTARLSENLFLDLLAAGGTSSNSIRPDGTYEDGFSTVRFMASAALQGEWTSGNWTFDPRARFGWFHERSNAYIDGLGVSIPVVESSIGQFAVGPGVSYSHPLASGAVIDTGLRFEAVADILAGSTREDETRLSGRIEARLGITTPGGARLSLSAAHSGIGQSGNAATTGRMQFTVPLN
ncbi:MAG: Ig-like domain repeat protein [Neoaquamicrobium sediminum]|uniref:Ig-like domain repeat protein n=1 Tax=Neoaquamicrobium sediminum TaxID=1849104 RepID=UPI004035528F